MMNRVAGAQPVRSPGNGAPLPGVSPWNNCSRRNSTSTKGQKQTLKQAFDGFDGLPEWMENEKPRFELHQQTESELINRLSMPLPFFHLFPTPPEYGPDVFLICKVDGRWYCISCAIKFYGDAISKR